MPTMPGSTRAVTETARIGASSDNGIPDRTICRMRRHSRIQKKTTAAAESTPVQEGTAQDGAAPSPKIHVPEPTLGEAPSEPESISANGDAKPEADQPKPKKKTRRGSRGGRGRKKKPAAAASANGADQAKAGDEPEAEPASDEYVPMSEWIDEVETR